MLIKNRSGSGKTTLFKTALGITEISSGDIIVDRIKLTPEDINHVRSKIFYLDQDVNLPELTVDELLKEVYHYKSNRDKKLNRDYLSELFDMFKLDESHLYTNTRELSGGERQRVGLIIGFLLKRPLWLLDEPTSALDQELKDLVASEVSKLDTTALIISHDSCWDSYKTISWEVLNND